MKRAVPSRLYDVLSLRVLKLISALEAAGSLAGAAAQSHIVPSAASRRVRQLEEAIGFELLDRTPRGAVLTPAGRAIARYAHKIVADVQALDWELQDLRHGVSGHVTLLASASAIVQHLPEDLARFLGAQPNIRVDLQEHSSDAIVEKLLQGSADVGVLVVPEQVPGLKMLDYRHERLVAVLPESHRLSASASVRFDELIEEDWIGLPAGTALADLLARQAQARGVHLRQRLQVKGMDSTRRMVQNGLGVSVLPQASLEQQGRFQGLVAIPLDEPWAERISKIAWNSKVPLSPASTALIDALVGSKAEDRA
jgi:DNA-binding transcriptional LysR family regulator